MRRWIGWTALVALLGVLGWQGYEYRRRGAERAAYDPATVTLAVPAASEARSDIVTVDEPTATDPNLGATPMAERVAVVGLLNKRNGAVRDLTMKPGQAMRVGGAVVRLRACEQTAPYEQEQLTGAFVQLDVQQLDKGWRRAFSGWVYKERPALNVVLHQVYDVWVKSCTMSFPTGGPESAAVAVPAAEPARARSSAPKSPRTAPVPAPSPSASPSADANAAR